MICFFKSINTMGCPL